MAFYGYEGNANEHHWTPYSSAHDYEYSSPYELSNSLSSAYYNDNCSEHINYTSSYDYYEYPSETSYSQPRFLQYEPSPHYQGYFPSEMKFAVSYNKVTFNEEPEFIDYDPTPYDGGYDQRMTYGKPLPPSDLTCYPRSQPQSDNPPLENFSYDSIPSPYGKDDDIPIEPQKRRKPPDTEAETERQMENGDGKDAGTVDVLPKGDPSSYGTGGDYGRTSQLPYGSGLEAMDLCESIFGYWPCLAKQQRIRCEACDQSRRIDPWVAAADYLFGTVVPYDYDNYHHQQSPYQSDQPSWQQ